MSQEVELPAGVEDLCLISLFDADDGWFVLLRA